MRRHMLIAMLFVTALAFPPASMAQSPMEENVERPGADYLNLVLEQGSPPRFCRDACQNDERCHSWTYVRPGAGDPNPRCFLKSQVPEARPNPCCVSGVAR